MKNEYSEKITAEEYNPDVALGARRVVTPSSDASRRRPQADASHRRPQDKDKGGERRRQSSPSGSSHQRRPRRNDGLIGFILDKRTHLALGIVLCVAAFVMAASCVSFMFNGMEDQSIIHNRSLSQVVDSAEELKTAGGAIGAKVANFLLVDTLGIGSFIIAYYLFMLGLSLMRLRKCRFWSLTFKCLFSAVAVSVILGLLTYRSDGFFHLGGNHGYQINKLLHDYSGALGAYSVAVILAGIMVAVFLNPVKTFLSAASKALPRIFRAKDAIAPLVRRDDTGASRTPAIDDLANPEETPAPGKEGARRNPPSIDDIDTSATPSAEADSLEGFSIDDRENDVEEIPVVFPETKSPERVSPTPSLTPAGPELEIVRPSAEGGDSARKDNPSRVIADGDHIGLDEPFDHRAELSGYVMPGVDLLLDRPQGAIINDEEQEENKNMIINTLKSYNIEIAKIKATIGPTVTLYEIVPAEGVRIAQIRRLEDDIAMKLAALGIRIIAPMPGKGTIGLEVPNRTPRVVSIRSVLDSDTFREESRKMALPMALGSTISNDILVKDLTKMPHLLVAGATGQGKSVGLNCIIASLLYTKHPTELKFVLIDPKMVEFSLYKRLRHHYLAKLPDEDSAIITDPSKVVATLNSLCVEMDNRYELLSDAGVVSLEAYNRKFTQRRLNPEAGHRYLPYIVMIVDEFADLIMTAGKDVSQPIARIAQKARAVGMHMIIATQRPSTDVITGMIKANFPGRIAFRVQQMVDSKTILDRPGANQLIGRGDMLLSTNGIIERVQCAFIDTEEIEAIVSHVDSQTGFPTAYLLPEPPVAEGEGPGSIDVSKRDSRFNEILRFVATQNVASTSMLQSEFEIGFNRARRIMDQFYKLGIVGPQDGVKPRQVLIRPDDVPRYLAEQ